MQYSVSASALVHIGHSRHYPIGWLTRTIKKNRRALRTRMYTYEQSCARVLNSLEPLSLIFSTGAVNATSTSPPTKTPQIRQTTDGDDDFVDGIIGGAIVLGMILMIYACHSCYIRFCRNRQDNAGAILNLPNIMQSLSQFPIGPPFLHKDDGITLVNQDWTTLFSVRGESIFCDHWLAWPLMSNVRGVCFFLFFFFSVLLTGISFTSD